MKNSTQPVEFCTLSHLWVVLAAEGDKLEQKSSECYRSQVALKDYYGPFIGVGIIHYLILTLMTERISFSKLSSPCGHVSSMRAYFSRFPGLPIPSNLYVYRHSKWAYLFAYICAFNLIAGIFAGHFGIVHSFSNAPVWLAVVYKIFAISLVALTLLPLFISVNQGGFINWAFGALYSLFHICILSATIIRSTCMNAEYIALKIAIQLPSLVSFICLLIYFLRTIWFTRMDLCNNMYKADPIDMKPNVDYVSSHVGRRASSQKHKRSTEALSKPVILHKVTEFYNSQRGFSYPLGLLWSLSVGLMLQYFLMSHTLFKVYGLLSAAKMIIENVYPDISKPINENIAISNARRVHHFYMNSKNTTEHLQVLYCQYTYFWMDVIWIAIVLASSIASFSNCLCALNILSHYKTLTISIYAKGFGMLSPIIRRMKAFEITNGAIIFPSFQIAFMVCGFYCQTVFYVLIGVLLAHVICLNAFTNKDFLVKFMTNWWPGLLIMTIFTIIQQQVIRFVFTQGRGKTIGFNNTRWLQLYVFFAGFYNVFFGLISSVFRLLYCPVSIALVISRLDVSPLATPIQSCDVGYTGFLSYIYMDVSVNNPILRTFAWILTNQLRKSDHHLKRFDPCFLAEVRIFGELFDANENNVNNKFQEDRRGLAASLSMDEELVPLPGRNGKEVNRRRILNRWLLAYTLITNPGLKRFRKSVRCE